MTDRTTLPAGDAFRIPTPTPCRNGFYEVKDRYVLLAGWVVAIITTFTGAWQLALLPGFLVGFLPEEIRLGRAFIVSFLGTYLAWLPYFVVVTYTGDLGRVVTYVLVELAGFVPGIEMILFGACATFGGVVAGFGALNGVLASRVVVSRRRASTRVTQGP